MEDSEIAAVITAAKGLSHLCNNHIRHPCTRDDICIYRSGRRQRRGIPHRCPLDNAFHHTPQHIYSCSCDHRRTRDMFPRSGTGSGGTGCLPDPRVLRPVPHLLAVWGTFSGGVLLFWRGCEGAYSMVGGSGPPLGAVRGLARSRNCALRRKVHLPTHPRTYI